MGRAVLVVAAGLLCGCSSSVLEEQAAESGTVIGVVSFRDERLTIRASGAGPRFDVVASDGRALSRGLDDAGLAERHSELYDVYRSSYAARSAVQPFLDARVDLPSVADTDDVR